jgi:hypothetical protein
MRRCTELFRLCSERASLKARAASGQYWQWSSKRQHHRHLKLALEDIQNFRDNSRKTKDVEATTQPIQREIYCD